MWRTDLSLAMVLVAAAPAFCPVARADEILPIGYDYNYKGTHAGTWNYDPGIGNKLIDGRYGSSDWTQDPKEGAAGALDLTWAGWWGIGWNGDPQDFSAGAYSPATIEITFDFGGERSISSVAFGSNQDALYNWNVVFPSQVRGFAGGTEVFSLFTPFDRAGSGSDFGPNFGSYGGNNGSYHQTVFSFPDIRTSGFTLQLDNLWNFENASAYTLPNWDNSPGSSYNGMFWIFVDEVDFYGTAEGPVPVPEPATAAMVGLGLLAVLAVRRRRTN